MRITSYGTLTESKEKSETEIAFEYVIETAREVGMEVIEKETSIDFLFIAELIKRLKEHTSCQP